MPCKNNNERDWVLIDLLRQRRSIRQYLAKQIDEEKIKILEEALLRSPSSRNFNPWEFIFVQDGDLIEKLSRCKQHGSAFLKNAPLAIVVIGDSTKSDVWIEDCSIASILVQLTAQSLSLGSCWVQIRLRDHNESKTSERYIQEIFKIPEHLRVESVIGIGYPAEKRDGLAFEKLEHDRIHCNTFGCHDR